MGHRPSWLPVAPSYGGQQAVLAAWLPALLVPGRFATEGLAWVRTSGGPLCALYYERGLATFNILAALATRAPYYEQGHVAIIVLVYYERGQLAVNVVEYY